MMSKSVGSLLDYSKLDGGEYGTNTPPQSAKNSIHNSYHYYTIEKIKAYLQRDHYTKNAYDIPGGRGVNYYGEPNSRVTRTSTTVEDWNYPIYFSTGFQSFSEKYPPEQLYEQHIARNVLISCFMCIPIQILCCQLDLICCGLYPRGFRLQNWLESPGDPWISVGEPMRANSTSSNHTSTAWSDLGRKTGKKRKLKSNGKSLLGTYVDICHSCVATGTECCIYTPDIGVAVFYGVFCFLIFWFPTMTMGQVLPRNWGPVYQSVSPILYISVSFFGAFIFTKYILDYYFPQIDLTGRSVSCWGKRKRRSQSLDSSKTLAQRQTVVENQSLRGAENASTVIPKDILLSLPDGDEYDKESSINMDFSNRKDSNIKKMHFILNVQGTIRLTIFWLLFIMLGWSYGSASFMDPGFIPEDEWPWNADPFEADMFLSSPLGDGRKINMKDRYLWYWKTEESRERILAKWKREGRPWLQPHKKPKRTITSTTSLTSISIEGSSVGSSVVPRTAVSHTTPHTSPHTIHHHSTKPTTIINDSKTTATLQDSGSVSGEQSMVQSSEKSAFSATKRGSFLEINPTKHFLPRKTKDYDKKNHQSNQNPESIPGQMDQSLLQINEGAAQEDQGRMIDSDENQALVAAQEDESIPVSEEEQLVNDELKHKHHLPAIVPDEEYAASLSPSDQQELWLLAVKTYYMKNLSANDRMIIAGDRTHGDPNSFQLKGISYCPMSHVFKPFRTTFCHINNRCVAGWDHWCPFVGNYIAYRNYKSFCLFLIYGSLLSVFLLYMAVFELIPLQTKNPMTNNEYEIGNLALHYAEKDFEARQRSNYNYRIKANRFYSYSGFFQWILSYISYTSWKEYLKDSCRDIGDGFRSLKIQLMGQKINRCDSSWQGENFGDSRSEQLLNSCTGIETDFAISDERPVNSNEKPVNGVLFSTADVKSLHFNLEYPNSNPSKYESKHRLNYREVFGYDEEVDDREKKAKKPHADLIQFYLLLNGGMMNTDMMNTDKQNNNKENVIKDPLGLSPSIHPSYASPTFGRISRNPRLELYEYHRLCLAVELKNREGEGVPIYLMRSISPLTVKYLYPRTFSWFTDVILKNPYQGYRRRCIKVMNQFSVEDESAITPISIDPMDVVRFQTDPFTGKLETNLENEIKVWNYHPENTKLWGQQGGDILLKKAKQEIEGPYCDLEYSTTELASQNCNSRLASRVVPPRIIITRRIDNSLRKALTDQELLNSIVTDIVGGNVWDQNQVNNYSSITTQNGSYNSTGSRRKPGGPNYSIANKAKSIVDSKPSSFLYIRSHFYAFALAFIIGWWIFHGVFPLMMIGAQTHKLGDDWVFQVFGFTNADPHLTEIFGHTWMCRLSPSIHCLQKKSLHEYVNGFVVQR